MSKTSTAGPRCPEEQCINSCNAKKQGEASAFLRKANKKTSKKESQSEVTNEINAAEEMTKKTADEDDSDRDLDLDSPL